MYINALAMMKKHSIFFGLLLLYVTLICLNIASSPRLTDADTVIYFFHFVTLRHPQSHLFCIKTTFCSLIKSPRGDKYRSSLPGALLYLTVCACLPLKLFFFLVTVGEKCALDHRILHES